MSPTRHSMDSEKTQPWPASWPPFWRAALHVAIAAGVGNFVWVLSCGRFDYPRTIGRAIVGAEAGVLLTVLAVSILGRVRGNVMLSLLVAYSLGALVGVLIFPATSNVMRSQPRPLRLLLPILGIGTAYPLIGAVFASFNPRVSRRGVAYVIALSFVLHGLAVAWAYWVAFVGCAHVFSIVAFSQFPPWCRNTLALMWIYASFALCVAITARLFLTTVENAPAGEK